MRAMPHCGGAIIGLVCLYAPLAAAQSTLTEWSSTEQIIKGNCGDGAIAHVVERARNMAIEILINGKPVADFNIPLASDGSGKAEFEGATGRNIMEVPAGAGKRPMKNARTDGACQWSWSPK